GERKCKGISSGHFSTSLVKGREGAESNSEDSPTDDVEEDDNDAEKPRDDETAVDKSDEKKSSAENFSEKESVAEESDNQEDSEPPTTLEERIPVVVFKEEPPIWTNVLNEVPELRQLFDAYNMHWMDETPGKYSLEMVHEFYINYYCTWENNAPSRQAIKKEPMLDSVRARAISVNIFERTITRVLMG
ncbi:hypothetical protein HAX54_004274, partial [Datura stramonium]|nr:hypothetical protein [Datura stramonium]